MRSWSVWWFTGALLLVNMARSQQPASVAEQELLAAANQDRVARQLHPLHLDESLVLAARRHASAMAQHRSISHKFDREQDLATRAAAAGAKFSLITENVAEAPRASEIHELWMASAGHRANLLDPKVDAVGIAVVQSHGEYYAVEDFAHTLEPLSLEQQERTVTELLRLQGIAITGSTGDARRTCELSTGFVGPRKPWFVMRYTSSAIDRLPAELTARLTTGKYGEAAVGACLMQVAYPFSSYSVAVLLYP